MNKKKLQRLFLAALYLVIACIVFSCRTTKPVNTNYIYFKNGPDTVFTQLRKTLIQPNDRLSIQVYSKTLNQEQATIFNIPATANTTALGYQVNEDGNIEMPVLGTVAAAGLTKDELEQNLIKQLSEKDYVKDPSVLVQFLQFNVDVLGEVKNPGMQKFNGSKVSIIDAISAAGDLTDYGQRENVTVIREENNKKIYYKIDLRSKTIFQSPVYTLQPNDIVYVSPDEIKLKQLNRDPDTERKTNLLITGISVLISVATLIITATK